jgi:Putative MetA-pathway of phenol degradation
MRRFLSVVPTTGILLFASQTLCAQDLAPRAYIITPIHSNAIVITYSYSSGNLNFDGSVPITDATAKAHIPILSYFHSMRFLGRTASFTASLPYGVANFRGAVLGSETNVYRSGLFDSVYRVSVNIKGGPAMDLRQIMKWRQKTLIGVSLVVRAPTGQYDSTKLINYGNNRWAFKPELGLSRRWGHWVLDAYGGAWLYSSNPKFFSENQYNPNISVKTQSPVGAFEGHLSYDVRPRLWASLDGNFWFGGRTSLNGVENPDSYFRNSRVGATVSIPFTQHSALKVSYSNGAYIRYGGNFQNISVGWQYSWLGRPN